MLAGWQTDHTQRVTPEPQKIQVTPVLARDQPLQQDMAGGGVCA